MKELKLYAKAKAKAMAGMLAILELENSKPAKTYKKVDKHKKQNIMTTLKIEDLKIKSGKSAYSDLSKTKNVIERANTRIESGRDLNEGQMNEYKLIIFCIESGKEIVPDYLEGALMFAREDYSGAIEMVKKGME